MRKRIIFFPVFVVALLTFGVANAAAACNGQTTTITGTSGVDVLTGTAGVDVIEALGGDDTIYGLGANDVICAGDGYDTIVGGGGNDWIDGGVGGGVVDYSTAPAAMTIDLTAGTAVGDGSDTITSVNDAYGSTSYADIITGNANNNYLVGWGGHDFIYGLSGADVIQGLDGDDTIEGGLGNDNIQGGNGTDIVSYANASGAVTVSLATTASQNTINDGSDTIASTTENLTGSAYNDTLTGSTGANAILGLGGNDTISAGDGADTITGGLGVDILHGELGNDILNLDDGVTDSATTSTCGGGTDIANKDAADTTHADCETVNIAGGDTTPPTASLAGFTEVTGNAYQHSVGSTMWVNPTQPGSFGVDVNATDAGSGMMRVEYPTLGTGWSPAGGNDNATPFTYVYTWSVAPSAPGLKNAVARDNAGNTTNVPFTVATDSTGPATGTVTYLDGYTGSTTTNITFTIGADAASGTAAHQLQRRSATLTGTTCGTYGSWANIGSASPASPYADATIANNTCYQYQLTATDNVGNSSTTTGASTLRVERTAPTGLAVSNLTGNTRIDGVAVLSWTGATDSQSGIGGYEVKAWPDGAAEPADSEFRPTGSTLALANVRIGINPTTSPWDWKFRVRAVDVAGNKTASSSVALLDDPTNQATGTSGDQSTNDLGGAGMQVGHSTGNLSINHTDVSTKAYGVDLVVQRTYNHQNIQLQPVIGDSGWNNSPAPADTNSYTSQWAFGFHHHASFEQRLVSGDDGTSAGNANARTFIDETGTNWPFTATASGANTYASPVGMDDWTLVKNPNSTDYPTCETGGVDSDYALRQKGGSTKCFDTKGRLLRETMRNGRSITYTRNGDGRVTEIAADDPDGAGSEQPLKLTLAYNADKRVSKITDQLGRETRYDYVNYSGMYYLNKIEKYADSGSSTALTRTDYAWDANANGRRIIGIDEWIYADDPGTGTANDALKHHWDVTYSAANRVATVTEAGTVSRAVGAGSETIPAVVDTITTMDYMSLTSGGTAATLKLDVKIGTSGVSNAFGTWTYTLDNLGRPLVVEKPLEAGASVRADSETSYTPEGRVKVSETERDDVTTYTYNTAGNATLVDVDPAAASVPNQITEYQNHTALGDAQATTAVRSPDGSFLAKWPYALNDCVDAGVSGTFKVTTAGTSASAAPAWPGSGSVSSGTVTFLKQACTATSQGLQTLHQYDSNGNETQQTDPLGVRTCTYYAASGEIDVEYKLDGANCPGSPAPAARIKGTLKSNTYNAKGFLTQTVTDESTTKFTFDVAGQKTQERLVVDSGDSSKDIVTDTSYDGAGRAVRETRTAEDGSTRNTSTGYSMVGAVTNLTVPNATYPTGLNGGNAAGDVTTTRFSARGLGYIDIRPDNTIVTRKHDGRNRETFVSIPHAQSNSNPAGTAMTYYLSGVKKTKTDPAGTITTFDGSVTSPGADERPLKIESPAGGTTTLTYNAEGGLATKTTGAGSFTYGYDGNGNRVKTVYPSGDSLVEVHDRQGNVTERRFTPNGGSTAVTQLNYRADSKLLVENQSSGIDTSNTYATTTGQLEKTELADDGSAWTQETRFVYDAAGRLESQTLENGATDLVNSYVYEGKSGRLKRVEQPNSVDQRLAYDPQGRISESKIVKRSDSSWQSGDTYGYDSQGRVTTRTRRDSGSSYATTYSYDPSGQLTGETTANGIVRAYTYRNANDQDAFGTDLSRQTLHVTSAPAGALSLARVDELETCLTQATCGAADSAAINTAITSFASPGATIDPAAATSTAADVARWLALRNNRNWASGTAFALGTCIAPNGWQWERYKVTTAGTSGGVQPTWPASGTVSDGSVTWTKTTCTPVLVLRNYTYDANSPSRHQLVKVTGRTGVDECLAYDGRGNQSYRGSCPAGSANQTWDSDDRETQLKDDSGATVTLTWDEDSRRLKTFKVGAGATRTLLYGAGNRIVRATTASWSVAYAYDGTGVSAFETGGSWYYVDRDKRGDAIAIRDAAGSQQAYLRYNAWGEVSTDNPTLVDKLMFTYGGRDGAITVAPGLYAMGHRVYSSAQARFVSVDPEQAKVGVTDSNYGYAGNDPINRVDPSGRAWYWDSWDGVYRYGNGCSKSPDAYYGYGYRRCSFRAACEWHDKCYSSEYRWRYARKVCDDALYGWWKANCNQTFTGWFWNTAQGGCLANRWTSYQVLRRVGGGFYHGGGVNN